MILKLRKDIFPLLVSGVKTSTSRQGKRDVKIGESLTIQMTEDPGVEVKAEVTNVKYCKFSEISENEAHKEGYKSLMELKNVLMSIYNINESDDFTLIEFKLI